MPRDKLNKGEGHRSRLREKFLNSGLSGFHDYEVVELLLALATPQKDCKEAAKEALQRFQTLSGVLDAPVNELCEIKGIGPKNIFGIKLVPAVAERYLEKKVVRSDPVSNANALFDYLYHSMAGRSRECFKVLFLDAKNRVLATEVLFEGSLTAGAVYPREVVKKALDYRAAAVIFAHNHPSGDPEPSAADVAITRRLVFACMSMGITVHEHLVIGDRRYYSFADAGHISRMCTQYEQEFAKYTADYD
ncbi:MAG: DNA repair protein RadC [Desulfobacteraceae bacterium]|nr:DNA repair protein RadC [Desulfobacteraceae bacterium]